MPILYVLSGPEVGRQLEVAPGAVLGRADDCDAVLRHRSVSRRHARIETERGDWRLVDLASRNGLFQGGRRVKALFLEDGTEFRLGDVELRVRFAPEEAAPPPAAGQGPEELAGGLDETVLREAPGPRAEAVDPGVLDEEFEFADETPAAPHASVPPRAAAGEAAGGIELEEPDEISLEGPDEIELEPDPAPRAPRSAPSAARAAARRAPDPRAAARRAAGAAPTRPANDSARQALQYGRVESRGGFLSADLAQYPAWVKAVAYLLAVVLFAGLFMLAYRAASTL